MADMFSDATKAGGLAIRIIGLLLLVFALVYVLTWTNTIKCSQIPGWCDVYYGIRGHPRVLIAYGDDGLGDAELLNSLLSDPRHAGVRATALHINHLNIGNLKEFEMVIVTQARTMSSQKVKMFVDYADSGGKLVWTGDAAAKAKSPEEYLYRDDISLDKNVPHEKINAWARKHDGYVVQLSEVLSLEYLGNYSDIRGRPGREILVGNILPINRHNPLVLGVAASLPLHITPETDFAIVRQISRGTSTTVMTLDFGSKLYTDTGEEYERTVPFIITNARASVIGLRIGENIVYYSMPLEYLAHPSLSQEHRYHSFLANMYYGMIYG